MIVVDDGRTLVRQGNATIGVVFLAPLFGSRKPTHATMIETTIGGSTTGIVVDAILGEEEVFVRPLPDVAGAPAIIEGIVLLSTGRPVAMLSLKRFGPLDLGEIADTAMAGEGARPLRVLLTDDTVATREMTASDPRGRRFFRGRGGYGRGGPSTNRERALRLCRHRCRTSRVEWDRPHPKGPFQRSVFGSAGGGDFDP